MFLFRLIEKLKNRDTHVVVDRISRQVIATGDKEKCEDYARVMGWAYVEEKGKKYA